MIPDLTLFRTLPMQGWPAQPFPRKEEALSARPCFKTRHYYCIEHFFQTPLAIHADGEGGRAQGQQEGREVVEMRVHVMTRDFPRRGAGVDLERVRESIQTVDLRVIHVA